MNLFHKSFLRSFSRSSIFCLPFLILAINFKLSDMFAVITDPEYEDVLYDPYIDGELQNWVDIGMISESAVNAALDLPDKLKGLYSSLNNYPAVMNRRLLVGGSKPPVFDDDSLHVEKRTSFDLGLAQPACPFKTQWQLLYTAKDMNNTTVEVFQPNDDSKRYQWFYTVTCDFERLQRDAVEQNLESPRFCRGINRKRYVSVCVPRKSYIMALVRKSRDFKYDWDYIQVDTSCNCAVTPLPHI